MDVLFTSNPTKDGADWFVWDCYKPLPPKPIFFGTPEECGLVSDAKNGSAKTHNKEPSRHTTPRANAP